MKKWNQEMEKVFKKRISTLSKLWESDLGMITQMEGKEMML